MQNRYVSGLKTSLKILLSVVLVFSLYGFRGCDSDRTSNIKKIKGLGVVECIDQEETDTIACRGIPYAQPPVGELRWKPPLAVKPWAGVLQATEWPNRAPQAEDGIGLGTISEDCLYLNLTAPARTDKALPVMVFLHGGGLAVHTANSEVYNNTALPQQDVIVVTVNMRLGAMGYIAHPALTAESQHGVSGNYGTLDMIQALKWVRKYIRNFGGDPGNVTIFGESGGGSKVISLLSSPLAAGLFHRAIVESGSASVLYPTGTLATNEPIGVSLQQALGIEGDPSDPATLIAMRAKSMEEIVAAQGEIGYGGALTVDGWILPDTIPNIFAAGEQNNVPLMCGAQTRDLGTDLTMGVPTLANFMSAIQPATYVYVFRHLPANWRAQPRCAAFHGLELPYVFGHVPEGLSATIISYFAGPSFCFGEHGYDESDLTVAENSVKLWAAFARNGNPNYPCIKNDIDGGVEWPAYAQGEGNNYYLNIGDPMIVGTDPASAYIPAPTVQNVEYYNSAYGFTITYPDTLISAEAEAPAIWRVETETYTGMPWVQALVLPVADEAETLIDAFAAHLSPAQTIATIEASENNVEINGVLYDTATVESDLSLRSEIIGTKINDGADWIIFEKTQHINFGMPAGILDTVVWD